MIEILSDHRPYIMGILNVTPDSFSDGGLHYDPQQAVERARVMLEQGADIIDIGGESTRPGSKSVSAQEQIKRVIPVIEGICHTISKKIIISVDTTNHQVALAALEAGASWINDVSAGEGSCNESNGNEQMFKLAAKKNTPIVLMHRKGKSSSMQNSPSYENVVLEVREYLENRAVLAIKNGVKKSNIILDPGIGFGKSLQHNLALLANLDSLVLLGYPILLGASRKRFIGEICNIESAEKRVVGTCATTALGVNQGVQIFRVHDIKENRQAADIAWNIKMFN